jgi:uncharacterized protein with HEPN domain
LLIPYIKASSAELDKATFIEDETLKRAYVRSIGIMGEAVKQLPDSLRQKYTSIEWRALAGMGDRLVHNYFGVDYDIVWDVVINKVPILDAEIRLILEQEYPERKLRELSRSRVSLTRL